MTEAKKDTQPKRAAKPATLRIKLKLSRAGSKAFTSAGPFCSGSIIELPEAEAQMFIDRAQAVVSKAEVAPIDPFCNAEKSAGPSTNAEALKKREAQRVERLERAATV